ncbi:N66 matrix protein-like [Schistocerca nitens]|uniref:N66 matrix protein-like n=1 Tax=Schistocerca nitens TaxID=7011 RepID=UPI002118D70F|nr:N66 matrix protein-like [Schistocerca nitens]
MEIVDSVDLLIEDMKTENKWNHAGCNQQISDYNSSHSNGSDLVPNGNGNRQEHRQQNRGTNNSNGYNGNGYNRQNRKRHNDGRMSNGYNGNAIRNSETTETSGVVVMNRHHSGNKTQRHNGTPTQVHHRKCQEVTTDHRKTRAIHNIKIHHRGGSLLIIYNCPFKHSKSSEVERRPRICSGFISSTTKSLITLLGNTL